MENKEPKPWWKSKTNQTAIANLVLTILILIFGDKLRVFLPHAEIIGIVLTTLINLLIVHFRNIADTPIRKTNKV